MTSALRIGHGYDLHRLQPGGPLLLGGVKVSDDVRPIAHSDGDVVLHALVDAMLGALALGDIGDMFPNDDPQWKNVSSRVFVDRVVQKLMQSSHVIQNIDITILAERPKLKPFKAQIVQSVASMLGIEVGQVNVKAGTNEGCDAIGRGEAIAAHAVVLLAAGHRIAD